MTERVDFYILKSAAPNIRLTLACRLAEKAYLRDLKVVILQDNLSDAKVLDELLWTFDEHSFVPHQLAADTPTPVHLTVESANMPAADLLLNLTDRLPSGWEDYAQVAEIIDTGEERRRLGRERFKVYRDQKVILETHQLDASADL